MPWTGPIQTCRRTENVISEDGHQIRVGRSYTSRGVRQQKLPPVRSRRQNNAAFSITTVVSPLTRDGQPRRRALRFAGAALHDARRGTERTCPEPIGSRRCRLVETGPDGVRTSVFVQLLAQAKVRQAPPFCKHLWMDRFAQLCRHTRLRGQLVRSRLLQPPRGGRPARPQPSDRRSTLPRHQPQPPSSPTREPRQRGD